VCTTLAGTYYSDPSRYQEHSFIGQVNNTLCYFGKLSSVVINIVYFIHIVPAIIDVSYGFYQIVTLKNFELLGERAIETRVGRCSISTYVSMPSRLTRNMSAFS